MPVEPLVIMRTFDARSKMSGTLGRMPKAFSVFMSMDKMVGPQFEKGLADIKKIAEALS